MAKSILIKGSLTDQEVVNQLEAFNFFKKEQYLRNLAQIIILLGLGLGMLFLFKNPIWGFRPILIAGGDFFFRYSFFGNLLLVIAFFRLAGLTADFPKKIFFFLGVLLFSLHGFSSLFDPTETFITNPFLGLLTTLYPLGLIFIFDSIFSKTFRWSWRFLTIASFLAYLFVFYIMYGLGVLFISSSSHLGKSFLFLRISNIGDLLRGIHFCIGLLYLIAILGILRRKKKIIPGFEKMEKIAYLK